VHSLFICCKYRAAGIYYGDKGGRRVELTTLPPSCAHCIEILGTSTSWRPKGLSQGLLVWVSFCLQSWTHSSGALS